MTRMALVPALAALCLATAPALAQSGAMPNDTFQSQDPMVRLQTDCGAPDIAEASIDACLERARVLDETNPSPSLDTLTAKLEQRASQSFNPNGVDQGVHQLPPSAPKTANGEADNQAAAPKALQPLDDSPGADPSDPKMDFKDMDNDDLPPVEDDSKIDDGPPPKTITDDAPPPGDPVGASDDDKGPHR